MIVVLNCIGVLPDRGLPNSARNICKLEHTPALEVLFHCQHLEKGEIKRN